MRLMTGLPFGLGNDGEDMADDMPRWRRLVPVALTIALALALVLLFILANRAAQDRDRALVLQQHSYEVIALAREVEATAARAESLLARYVVSLDANDGRRYADEWQRAGQLIETLRRTTRQDAVQRRNVAALRQTYAARTAILDDIALRTTYDQRLGALGRLYEANRSREADRVQVVLDAAIAHEKTLLGRRSTTLSAKDAWLEQITKSTSLVGVVLLVAVLFALWIANSAYSEHQYTRRLAEAEAKRVDDLEEAVRARTSELEIANSQLRTEMEERAVAEANLRQLHKMEAVGQLTGGIAHDFNNMLAVVTGGLELAGRRLPDDVESARRHIANAMEGANRAASLTRRLLAFARAEPLLPGLVDCDALIGGMSELIDRTIGDQIAVDIAAGADDWRIWADRHQLENALLNLCVNARDAMDGRGSLTISAVQATLAQGEVQGCEAGEYVRLSVRDTGHGMAPDVVDRVFEPFFTTKPVGKGTGLGLSQVLGYVQQCKGGIRIVSAPGKGTDVQIFLPRDKRAADRQTAGTPAQTLGATDFPRQTLLVVEDDARVLNSTLAALAELGHVCVSCADPAEAPALLQDHPEVSIILTDVLMPGISGPEMIARMRAGGMTKPVIYVTGYAGEGGEAGLLDGQNVLRKPFTLAQLERAIGEAADDPDGLVGDRPDADDAQSGGVAFSA